MGEVGAVEGRVEVEELMEEGTKESVDLPPTVLIGHLSVASTGTARQQTNQMVIPMLENVLPVQTVHSGHLIAPSLDIVDLAEVDLVEEVVPGEEEMGVVGEVVERVDLVEELLGLVVVVVEVEVVLEEEVVALVDQVEVVVDQEEKENVGGIQTVLLMHPIAPSMDTAGQRLAMLMEEMVHLQTQMQASVGLTMTAQTGLHTVLSLDSVERLKNLVQEGQENNNYVMVLSALYQRRHLM